MNRIANVWLHTRSGLCCLNGKLVRRCPSWKDRSSTFPLPLAANLCPRPNAWERGTTADFNVGQVHQYSDRGVRLVDFVMMEVLHVVGAGGGEDSVHAHGFFVWVCWRARHSRNAFFHSPQHGVLPFLAVREVHRVERLGCIEIAVPLGRCDEVICLAVTHKPFHQHNGRPGRQWSLQALCTPVISHVACGHTSRSCPAITRRMHTGPPQVLHSHRPRSAHKRRFQGPWQPSKQRAKRLRVERCRGVGMCERVGVCGHGSTTR